MHHFANLTALYNQRRLHALLHADEVMMHRTHSQQAWNGGTLFVNVSVRQDDVVHSLVHACLSLLAEVLNSLAQSARPFVNIEKHWQFLRIEALIADVAQNVQLCVCQHRLWQPHHLAVRCVRSQDVRAHSTNVFRQAHHQFLTDGVNGRVCYLSKLLAEVVEEYLWTVADDSQRCVVAHRCYRLLSCCGHGHHGFVDVLLAETEVDKLSFIVLHRVLYVASALQLLQLDAVRREPFAIWVCFRKFLLDFAIIINLALLCVNEKNLARLQTSLAHHVVWFEIHHAHF